MGFNLVSLYTIAHCQSQEEQTSSATHLEALRLRTAEHQEAASLARQKARRSKRCVKALEARCLLFGVQNHT